MILKIKCPKCSGPMWEEDLPDSSTKIDLACIICGFRRFFDKSKYLKVKKAIENRGKAKPATRRVVSTRV